MSLIWPRNHPDTNVYSITKGFFALSSGAPKARPDVESLRLRQGISRHKWQRPIEKLSYEEFQGSISEDSELSDYLRERYVSIESRALDAFRYITCHPDNAHAFSFELSSLLRDAGSVFGSALDKLVGQNVPSNRGTGINDYMKWLPTRLLKVATFEGPPLDFIKLAAAELNIPPKRRFLVKFLPHAAHKVSPEWWRAFNDIKHSDIDKFRDGNLENVACGIAAVGALMLLSGHRNAPLRLFRRIGLFMPEELEDYLFSNGDSR